MQRNEKKRKDLRQGRKEKKRKNLRQGRK